MTYLPIILIVAGYVALVVTAGPVGLALAGAHVGVMLAAVAIGAKTRRSERRGRANSDQAG